MRMHLNAWTTKVNREQDACGIFARIEKTGVAKREVVVAGVQALSAMRHRAGYVAGEGDGCGLQMDVPKALWQSRLASAGVNPELVDHPSFFVGHLFLQRENHAASEAAIRSIFAKHQLTLLVVQTDGVNSAALGASAGLEKPVFWQVAGIVAFDGNGIDPLYAALTELEQMDGVHVASLSKDSVVYKVVGDDQTLYNYHKDLQDSRIASSFVMAHTRYSTNTSTSFARVQPFSLLGHNGEINTISRFYSEAHMIGVPLSSESSDSQMIDRVLQGLLAERGWSLMEAMELVFPPILHEIKSMPSDLSDLYMFFRALWGPFAQGPAGVLARYGDEVVVSVDALGLRPLWWMETASYFAVASEQGIVPLREWVASPKALAPGEKLAVTLGNEPKFWTYQEMQQEVLRRVSLRYAIHGERRTLRFPGLLTREHSVMHPHRDSRPFAARAAAFGFREEDFKMLEFEMHTGVEPIKSLGFDSPIAAFAEGIHSVADFLQETVAVVTNPAIDREREVEHFSTRSIVGCRPSFDLKKSNSPRLEVQSPLLLEELPEYTAVDGAAIQATAHKLGTLLYEDVLDQLHTSQEATVELLIHRHPEESIEASLARISAEAVEAVSRGAHLIVLDDRLQFRRGAFVDPLLVLASVHKALLCPQPNGREHLRRQTGLVLRSGVLRNLHDLVIAFGLGADALVPYLMWEFVADKGGLPALENLYKALDKGLEKVISTLGIHELRGYERLFSGIGLSPEIAQILGVPNFCGSSSRGFSFSHLEEEAAVRQERYSADKDRAMPRNKSFQLYPRIWKSAGRVASGEVDYQSYVEKLEELEQSQPISLRHSLDFVRAETRLSKSCVDTSVDIHSHPLVISSMSFGSQGETAFRAYAEAAYRLNVVCVNGEGGEIKDMLHKYPRHRGRQIASGRFGVNAELCNDAYLLEIKIGQGAKPGEGGHLPGSKVTAQVAAARNAALGVDLISPSNNHDIYSIEDLAQVIYELKQVNPDAKVAVKVPVVPNIGTIAVGIVKAGADIVTLSGFDGGTGAARAHAIHHVGLPMEIGVRLAHDALSASGLRDVAEIWADGGLKSGADAMKAILLGANRVGFGTMAMVAIGCTSCRACHKDTCHVGIATQMTDLAEAHEKGLTAFSPREFEDSVQKLVRFFSAVGEHIAELTAALGATRTQDLVGRRDLLQARAGISQVDAAWLAKYAESSKGRGTTIQFRSADWDEVSLVGDATGTFGVSGVSEDVQNSARSSGASATVSLSAGASSSLAVRDRGRAAGARESGLAVRQRAQGASALLESTSVAGAGFAAFSTEGMVHVARGGAGDGVGKGALGGRITVLKDRCADGVWRGGSVGKGLAYGAQRGMFLIQGDADARAGIRLSGADVVIGGTLRSVGKGAFLSTTANVKGFAFEYMTNGRALVLGDPGPWICSGMTGGSVYLRMDAELGLTEDAIRRRIAKGAKVRLSYLDGRGEDDVRELLEAYVRELRRSGQWEEAADSTDLLLRPADHFMMIRPGSDITDQDIATE